MVECKLPKLDAAGSSPVFRSKDFFYTAIPAKLILFAYRLVGSGNLFFLCHSRESGNPFCLNSMPNTKKYFTVGPTEVFLQIYEYIQTAREEKIFSISHRSPEFSSIYKNADKYLRQLLNIPDNFHIAFLSSATECMERIIENTVEKESFHIINGFFARRFREISEQCSKQTNEYKINLHSKFEPYELEIPGTAELITITHNDTSSGHAIEMPQIKVIKEKYPNIPIALDATTSVPYYEIDFQIIDAAFYSVQKGFGMPPGLGVLIFKNTFIEKSKYLSANNFNRGTFFNFERLAENALKFQATVTPNIPAIYILSRLSEYLYNYGIDTIRKETELKSKLLYDTFYKSGYLRPYIESVENLSKTTLVAVSEKDVDELCGYLSNNGIEISRGYREKKDDQIRIANFPTQSILATEKLCELILSYGK